MRQLEFYEFTGILLPGAIAMAALVLLFPGWGLPTLVKDVSVGGLGIFIVLAYAAGHIVQAVGNLIEAVWWKCWGGMPTYWLRIKPARLLAAQQISQVEERLRKQPGLANFEIASSSASDWHAITHQIYAAVAGAGRTSRVDTFNGNYGLNRGLAAGLLVALALLPTQASADWRLVVCLVVGTGLALYRMHRFARHYARELFVQFLQLPERGSDKAKKPDTPAP
ncbi:hypothetical protein [Verminephrobacter eiseniae]|uniref:Uncharacterized protein n=1 Tax=Verminephrobacter eiseniae (strain EF01-2) TaxID=391735 RepID=A1WI74_VEREI|nr:hypothetical protein [Verminephrobacter eiseniae]ABM57331.1 hypothetical protein Veis_1572 [Verminephrobacter eiseniae EF01-2]MCW5282960.1 hypothetical protein [Verminephrobacter eiseniae]MCW5303275.1 hypothetical protein [Verminephrobacter eiseniae]MCW8178138.1 hypothetical protein [Verminephrobacter eiseniae]MCW8188668.1 hypothetical protein [Verminephrobacter eiseniae]